MGQNQGKTNPKENPPQKKAEEEITRNSFEFIQVIGRGGFGKVWRVFMKKSKKLYALKEMSKLKIMDKRSENSVISERNLLSRMNHP
ncbi:MAG: hypothetical protein MJ252_25945 [archaeon]|nr:hypothetical protein [archaeon]